MSVWRVDGRVLTMRTCGTVAPKSIHHLCFIALYGGLHHVVVLVVLIVDIVVVLVVLVAVLVLGWSCATWLLLAAVVDAVSSDPPNPTFQTIRMRGMFRPANYCNRWT